MTQRRIYVACLAAYNNGVLHGEWIDATTDADEMAEQVKAMLATSPVHGAEEFAIHDHEGLGNLNEYTPLSEIAERMEFFEACDDAGMPEDLPAEILSHTCGDLDYAKKLAEDGYRGVHPKFEDYAAELFDEIFEVPSNIAAYIDYEKFARDLIAGGDYFTLDIEDGEAVFDNHV